MWELWITNHGINGWDAETTSGGVFKSKEEAIGWITFLKYNPYYANNRSLRCAISYALSPVNGLEDGL